MKPVLSVAALALGLSLSATAFAGDALGLGDDEISLKSGGMLRGTIIAVEPGKEAIIVVDGTKKTIPWSKINEVERGKYKKGADSEERQTKRKKKARQERDEEEEEELTEPTRGAPEIHIESTYPNVELTRVKTVMTVYTSRGTVTGFTRTNICTAPCDQIVDGRDGADFVFTAPNMTPSSGIKLTQYSGEVEARVRGGSLGTRIAGTLMLIGGITSATVGLCVFPVGLALDSKGLSVGGGVALGVGVGLIIPGVLFISGSRTTVNIVPRSAKSAGVRIENGALLF